MFIEYFVGLFSATLLSTEVRIVGLWIPGVTLINYSYVDGDNLGTLSIKSLFIIFNKMAVLTLLNKLFAFMACDIPP